MRLVGASHAAFPFLDHGYKPKVGECSMEAFTALGGQLAANVNASDNRFLVLFLAFPQSAGQSADSMLTKFAAAANADDFPVMLAFVAQATLDAKNDRTKSSPREVDGDPVTNFQRWKASQGTRSPGVAKHLRRGRSRRSATRATVVYPTPVEEASESSRQRIVADTP
jgi:hypothetical protein